MKRILFIFALATATGLFAQQHPKVEKSTFSQNPTEGYLAIQKSLSLDDLTGAQEAALFYISAFQQSKVELNVESLTRHANAIASANDLSQAREAFKPLTGQAKMLFEYLSGGASSPFYVVRCGMAFDGQGAEWIQDSQEAANPYYGASMLRCGSVLGSIVSSLAQSSTQSSGCSHEAGSSQSCCSK